MPKLQSLIDWLIAASLVLVLAVIAPPTALAARVALVIGNDSYKELPTLQKARADAKAYADLLKDQGFDQVILKTDLTKGGMDEAIAAFVDAIKPGDTALFAYSGHGWSDGAQNYIVGTDAPKAGSQEFLSRISIPLRNGSTGILDDIDRRGASLKVAIIDACRDNPFSPTNGRSIGVGRGLSRIDPPRGTFVVFSAGTGQSALDRLSDSDPDPNSVFTRAFVPLLRAGLPLQEATQKARIQVVALASSVMHDQQPAYYDELLGEACLSGHCASGPTAVLAPTGDPRLAEAGLVWPSVQGTTSIEVLKAFQTKYAGTAYADFAAARIDELRKVALLAPPQAANEVKQSSAATSPPAGDTPFSYRDPLAPILTFAPPGPGFVKALVFSPDGGFLASAGEDNSLVVWSGKTGDVVRRIDTGMYRVSSIGFSRDGKIVAAGLYQGGFAQGAVRPLWSTWETATGRPLKSVPLPPSADEAVAVTVSSDGRLVSRSGGQLTAWDLNSGTLIRTLDKNAGSGSLVVSSDGARLLAQTRFFDVANGVSLRTFPGATASGIQTSALSPDGRTVATADGDLTVRLWQAQSGSLNRTLSGFANIVRQLSFSADGTLLATGGEDSAVRLWHVGNGQLAREIQLGMGLSARILAFSGDGRLLGVAADRGEIRVYDVSDLSASKEISTGLKR